MPVCTYKQEGEDAGNSTLVAGEKGAAGGGKTGGGKRKAVFDAPDSDKAGNKGGKGSVDMPLSPTHTKVHVIGGGGGGRRTSLDMADGGGGGGGGRSKVAGEGGGGRSKPAAGWMPGYMTGAGGGVAAPVYPPAAAAGNRGTAGSGDDVGGVDPGQHVGLLARISSKIWCVCLA